MKMTRFLLLAALALMSAGAALPTQAAAIKCWTNKEGVRECGESVPPEYSQQGHEVIKKGMVVDETEAAKTPEELEEEKRQAEIEAAKQQQLVEERRQDKVLLATFTNVADIERVRDEQIEALEAQIRVTQSRNEKIQQDLDKRIAAAAAEERAGKEPNEALRKDIESLKRQISNNDDYIAQRRKEQDGIRADYEAKISRFKELTGTATQ